MNFNTNHLTDSTGGQFAEGQIVPVWFVAGTTGRRIHQNAIVLFPVEKLFCFYDVICSAGLIESVYKRFIKRRFIMTKEGLAKVIGWALNDEDFKEKMKADPENTAKDKVPDLTPEELKFLKELNYDTLDVRTLMKIYGIDKYP